MEAELREGTAHGADLHSASWLFKGLKVFLLLSNWVSSSLQAPCRTTCGYEKARAGGGGRWMYLHRGTEALLQKCEFLVLTEEP